MKSESLPKFERPPLTETILGAHFDPLHGLGNAHLGAFWKRLGQGWTQPTDALPLLPQFERFGEESWGGGLSVQFGQGAPYFRMQIRNQAADRMVQIQNGQFHFNWLGKEGGSYPHYETVRAEFDKKLEELGRFLKEEALGEVNPSQWEVTYVNQIFQGALWNDRQDWDRIFKTPVSFSQTLGGASIESFAGGWQYEIPPRKGRLHISLKHGRSSALGGKEVLVLTLTARGEVKKENGWASLSDGLNLGHETIVKAFKEMTSDEAHKFWGLIHERP